MSNKTKMNWKRKMKLNQASNALFTNEATSDNEEEFVDDWRTLLPANKKACMLEDVVHKSNRLMEEGIQLAEKERYWEAITRFNECIELTPDNAKVYEMKSQVLLELGELFPARQAGEMAVKKSPLWSTAYQTLGRAQISHGEIQLALRSFMRAYHLDPSNQELFNEDITWARSLIRKKDEEPELKVG